MNKPPSMHLYGDYRKLSEADRAVIALALRHYVSAEALATAFNVSCSRIYQIHEEVYGVRIGAVGREERLRSTLTNQPRM